MLLVLIGEVMLTKFPRASDRPALPCLSLLLLPSPTGTEWVDPEDPTVIAENELLGAAAAIEAAAKKLEQLKPRAKPKVRPAPHLSGGKRSPPLSLFSPPPLLTPVPRYRRQMSL